MQLRPGQAGIHDVLAINILRRHDHRTEQPPPIELPRRIHPHQMLLPLPLRTARRMINKRRTLPGTGGGRNAGARHSRPSHGEAECYGRGGCHAGDGNAPGATNCRKGAARCSDYPAEYSVVSHQRPLLLIYASLTTHHSLYLRDRAAEPDSLYATRRCARLSGPGQKAQSFRPWAERPGLSGLRAERPGLSGLRAERPGLSGSGPNGPGFLALGRTACFLMRDRICHRKLARARGRAIPADLSGTAKGHSGRHSHG